MYTTSLGEVIANEPKSLRLTASLHGVVGKALPPRGVGNTMLVVIETANAGTSTSWGREYET